ncbi:ferrochelatase family protein, partial [Chlamydia psittaci 03DC29]
FLYC